MFFPIYSIYISLIRQVGIGNSFWKLLSTQYRTYETKFTERTTIESVWHKRKSGPNWRRQPMLACSQPSLMHFRRIADERPTRIRSRTKPNVFVCHPVSFGRSARFCCMQHKNAGKCCECGAIAIAAKHIPIDGKTIWWTGADVVQV